jgi:hypothetical protein
MSVIWQEGQLTWPFVGAAVYMVLVLLGSDYLWRVSRLGGRQIGLLAVAASVVGIAVIYWAGS